MNTLLPRRVLAALLLVGMVAGCIGIGLTHLLHAVQQLVFQGSLHSEHIPFRQLVQAASPLHRFWALLACGAVVGIAWTCLHRYGAPLCDIKTTVKQPARAMPLKTTLCHALLQIITVGMGSPLGREVAPREISVALATPLTRHFALTEPQTSLVLACASGAGLAAVYNVPFAATVFVLETPAADMEPASHGRRPAHLRLNRLGGTLGLGRCGAIRPSARGYTAVRRPVPADVVGGGRRPAGGGGVGV